MIALGTRTKTSLKAAALAATLLAGAFGGPATALPRYEINWDYYSDATLTDNVGGWTISCSGNGGRWGVQTEYAVMTRGDLCEREPPTWPNPPGEWFD
jgi:invasion protein IalB